MRKLVTLTALASVAAAIAVAPSAHAAENAYLRVDSIPGESTNPDMRNAIDVTSYSWSAENPITFGATGLVTSGRVNFKGLEIEKNVDAATPQLFTRMVQAQLIPAVELVVARTDGSAAAPVMNRYCVQNVAVVSQKQSGDLGGDASKETVDFAFGAVSQMYTRQGGVNVVSGWNGLQMKPVQLYPSGCPVKGI
jgi:type VI protein secretion system component Hcp